MTTYTDNKELKYFNAIYRHIKLNQNYRQQDSLNKARLIIFNKCSSPQLHDKLFDTMETTYILAKNSIQHAIKRK